MNQRQDILDLLAGKRIESQPSFSGLIHITLEGLAQESLTFHKVHLDAQKMAKAAASTFRLTGMPSAALPLDLCAPAEALGTTLNFYENNEDLFPQPTKPLFPSTKYLSAAYFQSADFTDKGRLPVILDAFRSLKEDIGDQVVISGILPGSYTLLLYLIEPGGLFTEMKREPNTILEALFHLSSFLSQIASAYRNAGADFITVHEMGGSPGFIGPAKFEQLVFPALENLIAQLPRPVVLSVCGNVNKSLHLLEGTGATAVSIDQTGDVRAARKAMKESLLFGNLDPMATLSGGDEAAITEAVRGAKEAGVDAVWPGCDLVPQTPIQNIKSFVQSF